MFFIYIFSNIYYIAILWKCSNRLITFQAFPNGVNETTIRIIHMTALLHEGVISFLQFFCKNTVGDEYKKLCETFTLVCTRIYIGKTFRLRLWCFLPGFGLT